ncbi:MAG: hypothetical protein LBP33_04555 [Candidatus Adiutrix sp.]|nr:hypothetical protein [Candidatus Adiutrix sp.]
MDKKILMSCLLGLSLVLTARPLAAAENAEELQIFEFDYDQQAEAPLVNLPPTISPPPARPAPEAKQAPIQAPRREAATGSPAARPAPAQPAKSAPAAKAEQALSPAQPQRKAPSAVSEEDLLEKLFTPQAETKSPAEAAPLRQPEPPSVNLSPAGAPSPTSVPAKPGEALVEKKASGAPAGGAPKKATAPPPTAAPVKAKIQSPAAPKKAAPAPARAGKPVARKGEPRSPGGVIYPLAPGRTAADYRFWELASANWRRVSSADYRAGSASLVSGRPLYPLDRAPLPGAGPPAGRPRNYW